MDLSNNASWTLPMKPLNEDQRVAGQMVMTNLAVSEGERQDEGWTFLPTSGNHVGGLLTSMSFLCSLAQTNTPNGPAQALLNTSWTVLISLEDMQHLASRSTSIPPQGSSRAFETSASNAIWPGMNPSSRIMLDELQRLASPGTYFPSQEAPS